MIELIAIGIVGLIIWGVFSSEEKGGNANYPTPSLKDSDGD